MGSGLRISAIRCQYDSWKGARGVHIQQFHNVGAYLVSGEWRNGVQLQLQLLPFSIPY